MELITTTRHRGSMVARDERHELIVQRYGNIQSMLTRFSPVNLRAIADNVNHSVEADVPSVVSMAIAYGTDDMAALLKMHIAVAMVAAGINEDKLNPDDIDNIALDMLAAPAFRTLNIAFALGFFQALRSGEYRLYGCKPIDFMAALNDYCRKAHDDQSRLHQQQERAQREKERQESARNAVTFAQYLEMKGLPPDTPNPLPQ